MIDIEELREIPRSPEYFINRKGDVLGKRGWINPEITRAGYKRFIASYGLRRLHVSVHIAMLEAFIEPRPQDLIACHADDIKTHNHIVAIPNCDICHWNNMEGCRICSREGAPHGNLRWDSIRENSQDSISNGTHTAMFGSDNPMSKLTKVQVDEIRELLKEGKIPQYKIAVKFGVSKQLITLIKHGRIWAL